jgi:hypothetical protein
MGAVRRVVKKKKAEGQQAVHRDTWPAPPPESPALATHDTIPTPPPDAHGEVADVAIPALGEIDVEG